LRNQREHLIARLLINPRIRGLVGPTRERMKGKNFLGIISATRLCSKKLIIKRDSSLYWMIKFYHRIFSSKHLFNGKLIGSKLLNNKVWLCLLSIQNTKYQFKRMWISIVNIFSKKKRSLKFLKSKKNSIHFHSMIIFLMCWPYLILIYCRIRARFNEIEESNRRIFTNEFLHKFMIALVFSSSQMCIGERAIYDWLLSIYPFQLKN